MSKRRERALKRKERDKPEKFAEDIRLSTRGRVIVYVAAAIFLIVGALMAFGVFP